MSIFQSFWMSVSKEFSPVSRIFLFSQYLKKKRKEKQNGICNNESSATAALQHPGLSRQPQKGEDYLLMTHINPCTAWLQSIINFGLPLCLMKHLAHTTAVGLSFLCVSKIGKALVTTQFYSKRSISHVCMNSAIISSKYISYNKQIVLKKTHNHPPV